MEETNKLEATLKQIDDYVPNKLEPRNDTEILSKELTDTKAYLEFVLRDLAEAKQQSLLPVVGKHKKNRWKWIALLETVVVLSGVIIFSIYTTNQQSLPVMKAEEAVGENTNTDTVSPVQVETTLMNNQLDQLVSKYVKPSGNEFLPSVVSLFGYEYLMFSNGRVAVYYRNEFPTDEVNPRQTIMIDNGTKIAEFDWDYNFEQGLSVLVPYCGEYFTADEEELVFPLYKEGSSSIIPKQLRSVAVHNLLEHEAIDIAKEVDNLFAATYEEISDSATNPDFRLKMSIGTANYTYAIKKEAYVNAVYDEENIISHEKYFTLTFDDNKIRLTSIPYLSEEEYLGEFSGELALGDNQLKLSNISYAAYCLANQEDEENGGVIIPRTEVLPEERICLWGFQHETFLLELSKVLEPNQIKQENLVKEENMLGYYEDGEKKSIAGIDVSKFQGEIDWKKVKEAGIEYAIIRVGFRGYNEGTLELDPYFEKNIKGATAAGLPVGVYFFSQAINNEEAMEEANFVLDAIKDYKVTYPVIIDTEHVLTYDARANKLSRQTRTDVAKTFCRAVQQKGYQPMIYANTKWMIMGIDLEQLEEYDLWFAYYGDDLTFPYQFDMYQYSSEGSIPGIKGNVDLNLSFKDYAKENKTPK